MTSAHSASAYEELRALFTRLARFDHLSAIAGWDMQTMMPPGGSQARSAALAELSVLKHQILTAPQTATLLDRAQQESLGDIDRANLLEMRRQYDNAVLVPTSLVEAKSLAGARCEHAWRTQRPANDWDGFSKNLREVVKLTREEAQIRAQAAGVSRYDALLNLYEPGMCSRELDRIFGDLKTWLPDLLQKVVSKQAKEPCQLPHGPFDLEKQRQLGLSVMKLLGFNFEAGRVDVSVHPFCGGVPEDVRITTRYNENEFLTALLGIVHETGHARYEQNLPREWLGQPVALARSTAIHESQSLLFEMQLARGSDFLKILRPLVTAQFGEQAALEESNFIRLNQRVKPGFIRVDADEVSYPAHVMLRYEIEQALVEGEIEVDDIPVLWNEKMHRYLGLDTVGNYRNGCMQDIHWTDGAFGYFPTYTLGAMYAAQLFQHVRNALPNLSADIAKGDLSALFHWLQHNIWQHGSRYPTETLITCATGEALNPRYFRQHLKNRYL
ncbi:MULTISPECIES: carboxypeptidase M32 [unclassified Serratia (in: enterobacteria)]|uniref:carboxypeptidase M32 n=1 Tax=unclassified Serratia (in: enterobacteria) TaxID=2647522 RepID=UPI00050256B4|nr:MULTISPECIES: carboxypeptidase M32 [unclassified Serratia (in: enterobacteria)]KFK94615.1 peptidase M32 [Serratia sp. Ag2]KFK95835.1 peptidase M32 [Serratia sp. Ag1]